MYDPAPGAAATIAIPDPLARADALEREITDLYAQINAASFRLLQLIAELDDEAICQCRDNLTNMLRRFVPRNDRIGHRADNLNSLQS